MSKNINKKLANLIKADLQDVLTNDSRWKVEGTAHYFQSYIDARDQIWVYTNNEEIKKALDENRLANSEWRKAERKGHKYNSEKEEIELENTFVWSHELEPANWQEIVSLIQQVKKMKEQKEEASIAEVERKLRSQKGLIYWPHREKRMSSVDKKGRLWYLFKTMENEKETWIYVPKNHSALVNFPFEKRGFYLITGVDHIPSVNVSKNRRRKSVSLQDNITITPSEVQEAPNIPNEKEKPINNPSDDVDGSYTSGKKDTNNFAPLDKSFLRRYFQNHDIKKITFKNGELIITHNNNNNNNNETITNNQLTNNSEYQSLKNSLERVGKQEITSQELGINSERVSTNTDNSPSGSKHLWLVGGIGVGIIIAGVIGVLYLSRKRKNK